MKVAIVLTPDEQTEKLIAALKANGMREFECALCGCRCVSRGVSNACPPCREGLAKLGGDPS